MRKFTLTSAGLLLFASVGFFAFTSGALTAPVQDQCIDPQTGEVLADEFCLCKVVLDPEKEPMILGLAGDEILCPVLPEGAGPAGSSAVIVPSNGGNGGGSNGGNGPGDGNGNWPGWGYGDSKHNHTGPPPVSLTGAPGTSDEGPPGLREYESN